MTEIKTTTLTAEQLEAQKEAEKACKADPKALAKKIAGDPKKVSAIKKCPAGQEHAQAVTPLTKNLRAALEKGKLKPQKFETIWTSTTKPKKGEVSIPDSLKTDIQSEVSSQISTQPVEITDPKDTKKTRKETPAERDIRVERETKTLIQKLAIEKKAEALKRRSAETGEILPEGSKEETISQRLSKIAGSKEAPSVTNSILSQTLAANFEGFNQDKDGKEKPFNADTYFKNAQNIASKLEKMKAAATKAKISPKQLSGDMNNQPDLSDPATAQAAAQATGVPQNKVNDMISGKMSGLAIIAKILLWFMEGTPPKLNDKGQPIDPKTNKPMKNPDTGKPYTKAEWAAKSKKTNTDNYKFDKNSPKGKVSNFRGKSPEIASKFQLNQKFYNKEQLRTKIVKEQSETKAKQVDQVAKAFKGPWQGAVYRNALKRKNFSPNQPLLLHNIGTNTAALYINGKVTYSKATHGRGAGNIPNKKMTPLGSFDTAYMSDNAKYTGRLQVKGVETSKRNYGTSASNAYSIDPASVGNTRADGRLIRVHQIRYSKTAGCTGLPVPVVEAYQQAARSSGGAGMEVFTSNAT